MIGLDINFNFLQPQRDSAPSEPLSVLPYLTLQPDGVLPSSAEASGGPNAYPRINL